MKINYEGTTVSFKTEPEELFLAEKSGAKSNTVRILDIPVADKIKCDPPEKIIIQYQHEIFQRTLTHICIAGEALGKVIVVFSWTNFGHNHTIPNETGSDPKAHTMSIDEVAKPDIDEEMSRELQVALNNLRGELPLNELIRKMLDCYLTASATAEVPTIPSICKCANCIKGIQEEGESSIDLSQTTILIPRTLVADLNWHRRFSTIPEFISKLLEVYNARRVEEERGPLHD